MKLRTKFQDEDLDLGEVVDVDIATMPGGCIKTQAIAKRGGLHIFFYSTKAEFDADWEDAPEEPKKNYWYIDADGYINSHLIDDEDFNNVKDGVVNLIAIGNHFETEEEAEKAVEKLKAWKRLKDRHFKFDDYDVLNQTATWLVSREYDQYENDIKLLFGGEE